jgi:hypothetical protein
MRVSLLLLRDLAWLTLLSLSIGLALLTLAVTQERGRKTRADR